MVKNNIFFYIHLVMLVCSAFWGWQKRMAVLITCAVCAVQVTAHLNIQCFPVDWHCYSYVLVLFYCVVVNVVFSLMVEKEKRRL